MPAANARDWDIFCRVIDNYGDAAVCWRLARLLAQQHACRVRLFIDQPGVLAHLKPGVQSGCAQQMVDQVEILHWQAGRSLPAPAQVVLEGFGCALEPAYLAAMAAAAHPPVWLNLEYLSAEDWVEGCHGLASPHPQLGLTKWFFFPGFNDATGGLLREADLFARREAAGHTAKDAHDKALRISMFAYENAALPALLEAWAGGPEPIHCAVAEGPVRHAVRHWLGRELGPHEELRGALRLVPQAFLAQDAYDALLWRSALNFVRGEDSFVRAQWAAKPLVWQLYPQQQAAHLPKLEAFLDRYGAGLAAVPRRALQRFHQAWNDPSAPAEAAALAWPALAASLAELSTHAKAWAAHLAQGPELAAALVKFVESKLKS